MYYLLWWRCWLILISKFVKFYICFVVIPLCITTLCTTLNQEFLSVNMKSRNHWLFNSLKVLSQCIDKILSNMSPSFPDAEGRVKDVIHSINLLPSYWHKLIIKQLCFCSQQSSAHSLKMSKTTTSHLLWEIFYFSIHFPLSD